MKETVKIGFIGLGRRGYATIDLCFSQMRDVELCAICDTDVQRMEKVSSLLTSRERPAPAQYTDYKKLLEDKSLDAVIIMTGWNGRIQCAIDSMNAGKYTAIEVGCAYDLSQCYELAKTYEQTGSPLMMLENCCYGRREMMMLRMAREGMFGEIVHCSAGYHHYLNAMELFLKKEDGTIDADHYRLAEYANRCCDQYPTHDLGPLSKLLNINRGNRMVRLSSFTSKSCGLSSYVRDHVPQDHPFYNTSFRQGDIITTIIDCAGGEQICLTLDTTLPRAFKTDKRTVRGTKGMCEQSTQDVCTYFFEGMQEPVFNNEPEFLAKYDHPLHAQYSKIDPKGGHGGMDWLALRAFVESVKNETETPIDIYDTVTWLAIGPLSEASIAQGSTPVAFPDFTNGKWFRRTPPVPMKYSLDLICDMPEIPIVP